MRAARTTINDVAALAGVSRAAVSKAVNGRPGLSASTRERIFSAASALSWSPSPTASALRGSRTRSIGLVISRDPSLLAIDQHFAVVIAGAESVLAPRGYGLQLHLVGEAPADETLAYRQLVRERRVDGFILTESRIADPRFELLAEADVPFVLIGTPWRPQPDVPHVRAAHPEVGLQHLGHHLVSAGHERILYVSGPDDRVHTGYRRDVFTQALLAANGPAPHIISTAFNAEDAARVTREALSGPRRPTAIVFANDTMAVAGMSEAHRMGLGVPADLAVVGHDDLPIGQWVHPRLTTVAQDVRGLGGAAAARLLSSLDESVDLVPPVLDPRLIVRASTLGQA